MRVSSLLFAIGTLVAPLSYISAAHSTLIIMQRN
jgi:hypothetical protein